MTVTVFSPAKINLYLAVTGRRPDGFHDLVSVVSTLDYGDELTATLVPAGEGAKFRLECDRTDVPLDESNLILRAARAFAEATGWPGPGDALAVSFQLTKRIPVGAGLGGGSSNAVAALRCLGRLHPDALTGARLEAVAATLGSDCALFLRNAPVIIRGRGERVELLPAAAVERLRGQRLLLFKPSFGISTPWAYGRMAAEAPRHYCPPDEAEERLAVWLRSRGSLADLLFNNMEGVAFGKHLALPVLLEKLRRKFGVSVRMSGSGSACFALVEDRPATVVTGMEQTIRESWGDGVFIKDVRLG